ncbi:MAG: hypothetical protein Rhims3KO_25240 [Hyphomicrobiales bacterium]
MKTSDVTDTLELALHASGSDHVHGAPYHESLNNLTPANVYFGRGKTILLERERIKRNTFKQRRLQYRNQAA